MSALSKGFRVLEAIISAKDDMTFSGIVAATRLPKASVHRLLRELVDISAVTFDQATRSYRGGLLLAKLGAAVTADYDIRRFVRPHLQALQQETGHVATLGIRDDDVGIYLDKIEARDFRIKLHSEVGKSFPLHCTAMGKVLLAHADAATVSRVSSRKLRAYTENTITDKQLLREELELVRHEGHAVDQEEITRALICVAAPVIGINGAIAGAISCTVPKYVVEDQGIEDLIRVVKEKAAMASGGSLS